jgi:type II secretory pathway pseudopilin PulG
MKLVEKDAGITLIELVVTLIIVVIMASLAGFAINQYIMDGNDSKVQADVATLSAAMRMYILDHGFPDGTVNLKNVLLPYLLISSTADLPKDPYSNPAADYIIERRLVGSDYQIYLGSRGHDGTPNTADDYYKYVR